MSRIIDLRAHPALWDAALTLNAAHETETGPLDAPALAALLDMCLVAPAIADGERSVAAFLLCLSEGVAYASPNYAWVAARLRAFAYIDRVIVAPAARGQGLGRRLYDAAAGAARDAGLAWLACEVNLVPPNPVSDAFHAALGFQPVGTAHLADRGKTMRYLALPLELAP